MRSVRPSGGARNSGIAAKAIAKTSRQAFSCVDQSGCSFEAAARPDALGRASMISRSWSGAGSASRPRSFPVRPRRSRQCRRAVPAGAGGAGGSSASNSASRPTGIFPLRSGRAASVGTVTAAETRPHRRRQARAASRDRSPSRLTQRPSRASAPAGAVRAAAFAERGIGGAFGARGRLDDADGRLGVVVK
jgi:hypothetical protein